MELAEKSDAILVGAGPAGTTAAYLPAKAGQDVVVIERGPYPGSKNVSGGLIYSRIYDQIYPNFWEDAPFERAIVGHSIVFLGDEASFSLDYRNYGALNPPRNAYSVRRAQLDPWLANQAEVFILEPKEPLGYPLPILKYPRFCARRDKGNVFICKSHVGLDLNNAIDAGHWDPDDLPMTGGTEPYFWDFLAEQLLENYPRLLESSAVNDWVGYRAMTQDCLPIVGDTAVEGYLVAIGGSGNGVILAPTIGRDLAKYIMTEEKAWIVKTLAPERFSTQE